ncbi:MAG: hypothetical protein M3347_10140 [Armatimonadota bacterium]|nr:hypothetical protein [Armatimonadota bacterium]
MAITLALLLCCIMASTHKVQATNAIEASVDSPYFKARKDINMDGDDPYPAIIFYMKSYLQAHRAIHKNLRLAQKLTRQRPELDKFDQRQLQLKKLNLSQEQIQRQPTYIYTIHILTYIKRSTLHQFVDEHWLRNNLHKHRVYKSQSKKFLLFIASGDVVAKSDPLYLQSVRFKGRKMTRLCYGIYENQDDANRDRRVLERHLGQRLNIIRSELSTEIIDGAWLKSLIGTHIDRWERD